MRKRKILTREKQAAIRKEYGIQQAMRLEVALAIKQNPKAYPDLTPEQQRSMAAALVERMRSTQPEVFANFCARTGN